MPLAKNHASSIHQGLRSKDFRLALRNTIKLNLLDLKSWVSPAPIIFALILNELPSKFKKPFRPLLTAPLPAWVIISAAAAAVCSQRMAW